MMKNTLYLFLILSTGSFLTSSAFAQIRPGGITLPQGIPQGNRPAGGQQGGGAILDDSTKNVYGPNTALHFYEEDILNSRDSVRYRLDTSLTDVHRWNYVDRSWNQLVDLGNLGTATRPTFFQPRQQVGAQLGLRAYDPYAIQQNEVRYYDTRSPLTEMTYVGGGKGRSLLRFGFNQNITPRLNVGFRVQRFTSNKQFGTFSSLGSQANLAQNWTFIMQGSYFSKDKKYTLLAHYRHLNQDVKEQGGLLNVFASPEMNSKLYVDDGPARLSDQARSWERRHVFHTYQQYKLANGFQLFQQGDFTIVKDRYEDSNPAAGIQNGVYVKNFVDSTLAKPGDTTQTVNPIRQRLYYHLFDTKLGFKGTFSGFTYRAYYRPRLYSLRGEFDSKYHGQDTTFHYNAPNLKFENILGGWLSYHLKDSTQHLIVEAEHLVGKDYLLRGVLSTRWFRAGYQSTLVSPDLIQQQYRSQYLRWNNDFKLTGTNTLYGALPIKTKTLEFTPEVQFHLLSNYIYYDTAAIPKQFNGSFSLLRIGAQLHWQLNKLSISGQGYYTINSNRDVIRIPAVFASAEVSYDLLYAKVLYIQVGVAAHYRSTYLADAYMPLTQQFHLQNNFQVDGYLLVDAFASLRIRRVRLILKMSHINQGLGVPGYYVTPRYMGLQRAFSFGVYWPLFD